MKEDIAVWIVIAIGIALLFWFGISVTNYVPVYQRVRDLPGVDKIPTVDFMRTLKDRTIRVSDDRIKGLMVSIRNSEYYFKNDEYWNDLSFILVDNNKLLERIFTKSLRYGWDEESFKSLSCILYANDKNHHYIGTRLALRWVKDVHNAIIDDMLRKNKNGLP